MNRPRGWITIDELPRGPKPDAVIPDLLDRYRQHDNEDTLPRGPRGIFYDLRPNGMPGNSRGVTYTKEPQTFGKTSMEATPGYVQDLLGQMRRVFDPKTCKWLIDEDWIADGRAPEPIQP